VREIALACGEYLLRRIREGDRDIDETSTAPYHAIHAPTLTVRASTAPPRH